MKKRLLKWMTVVLMLTLVLTGCSQPAPAPQQEPTAETPAEGTTGSDEVMEEWPLNQLTIIVPYSPGGTNDRQARALAPYIQQELGVPVIVENREGGGTTVAYNTHMQQDPADGSHIIFGQFNAFVTAIIRGAYEYDDFPNMGSMSNGHRIIAVNPEFSPFEDFEDFLKKVEANPGGYTQPVGAGWGLVFDEVLSEIGLTTRSVPYDGGGAARVAFMAGDIDFYVTDYESMVSIMEPGSFEALALLSDTSPYDHMPIANELLEALGYDIRFPNMISPRNFQVKRQFMEDYPDRFDFLSEALVRAANHPAFAEQMRSEGYIFEPATREESEHLFREVYEAARQFEEAFK